MPVDGYPGRCVFRSLALNRLWLFDAHLGIGDWAVGDAGMNFGDEGAIEKTHKGRCARECGIITA